MAKNSIKPISDNKKARFNYTFIETLEVGIVLFGNEVKSIRQGHVHLRDSYARIINNELWLFNCHIKPYAMAHKADVLNPVRDRKLLLHKSQLTKWIGKVQQKGLVLIPVKLYFSGQRVKIQLALSQSKKLHDKREQLKQKAINKDIRQQLKR